MFTIKPYNSTYAADWDTFVRSARNATFLHERSYMDYHADRFADASLLVFRGNRLCALFPANAERDTVCSHRGLTYGGLLLANDVHIMDVDDILTLIIDHYRANGIRLMIVKAVPYIYHAYCSDDLLYWLHRRGARVAERNLASCIDLARPLPFSTLRRRHIKNALKSGLKVHVSASAMAEGERPGCTGDDATAASWKTFWEILSARLQTRYNTSPVHTIDEILLLRNRFPERILLATVADEAGSMVAGTVLYVCDHAIHVQYIASTDEGRATGALDLLFSHLVGHYAAAFAAAPLPHSSCPVSPRYFDMGTSMSDDGRNLNEGLVFQKEGFGARSVIYDIYTLDL